MEAVSPVSSSGSSGPVTPRPPARRFDKPRATLALLLLSAGVLVLGVLGHSGHLGRAEAHSSVWERR